MRAVRLRNGHANVAGRVRGRITRNASTLAGFARAPVPRRKSAESTGERRHAHARGGRSRLGAWLGSARWGAKGPTPKPLTGPKRSTLTSTGGGVTSGSAPSSESSSRVTAASVSSDAGSPVAGQISTACDCGDASRQANAKGKPLEQRTATTNNAENRAKSRSARVTTPKSCREARPLSSTRRKCAQARLGLRLQNVLGDALPFALQEFRYRCAQSTIREGVCAVGQ